MPGGFKQKARGVWGLDECKDGRRRTEKHNNIVSISSRFKKIFRTESNSSPLCRMRRVISREKKEKKFKAQADQSETERADTV